MGKYKNIKCGYCTYSFTGGYKLDDGPSKRLGVPLIKCPKCGKLNKTGLIPWSSFTKTQKVFYWIKGGIYAVFMGGCLLVVVVGLIAIIIGKEKYVEDLNIILIIYIIGAILGFFLIIRGYKFEIKDTEAKMKSEEYQSYFRKS